MDEAPSTYPRGRANRFLLGDGRIVPAEDADEADDAEEESSSVTRNCPSSS